MEGRTKDAHEAVSVTGRPGGSRRRYACAAAVIVCLAGIAAAPTTARATHTPDDWTMFHHDPLHSGVSTVTAIGASTAAGLTEAWAEKVGGGGQGKAPVEASPAIVYNAQLNETLVYETSVEGVVDAFNAANGAVVWTENVGGANVASPAVDANTVYIASGNGTLWALNATTGAVQCSFTLPTFPPQTGPGHIQASPVVGYVDSTGPVVFVGDEGIAEKQNAGHEWAISGVGNTAGSCQEKWMFDGFQNKGKGDDRTGSWSSPGLVKDSTGRWLLVFGTSNPDCAVYALNATTGAEVWRFQSTITASDQDVGAGPTISAPGVNGFADGVVYIDGKDKTEYAVDLLTGVQIWSFDLYANSGLKTNSVSTAALVGNKVIVAYSGYIYNLNATTGALVWRTSAPVATIYASPSISGAGGDHVGFFGDDTGDEYGFAVSDGSEVFSFHVGHKVLASTAISDGMIFFASNDGILYAFR